LSWCLSGLLFLYRRWLTLLPDEEILGTKSSSIAAQTDGAYQRAQAAHSTRLAMLRAWIARRLRAFPRWCDGHLAYGELSLVLADIPAAYASAQVLRVLPHSKALIFRADFLLARVWVRKNEHETARKILVMLHGANPHHAGVSEELAAVDMSTGDFSSAKQLLETIPAGARSPTAATALRYLEIYDSGAIATLALGKQNSDR
jgi:hypothetical protein